MQAFDTVSEAIHELNRQGYVEDFNLKKDCLECRNGQYRIFANDFKVDDFFRFGGHPILMILPSFMRFLPISTD